MLAGGLLDEARALLARYGPDLRPLQAIGYKQAVALLLGHLDPAQARHDMVKATMRYAKRQMTWFRHQAKVDWFADAEAAYSSVRSWIG